MDDIIEVYLEHYGIKGMKWGVRKALTRGPGHSDHQEMRKIRTKKVSDMTDAEITAAVKRLRLLRDYKRQAYKFKNKRPEDMSNEELETESKRGLYITKSIKRNPIKGIMGIKKAYALNKSEIDKALNRVNLERQLTDLTNNDVRVGKILYQEIFDKPLKRSS